MPRARNIKPGFFKNDELAEIDMGGRLLFIGLWTLADREGRIEDRPKRIKAELFPYDDIDVDKSLGELQKRGFIRRYTAQGVKCIQVVNFLKHQNPHKNEVESELPAEEINNSVQGEDVSGTNREISGAIPEESRNFSANTVSLLLNPSSLNPDSLIPDSLNPDNTPLTPQRGKRREAEPEGFQEFWDAYPRHESKAKAIQAFRKLKPDKTLLSQMIQAIEKHKASSQWTKDNGQFIPHPSTWINQRRWEDELPEEKNERENPAPSQQPRKEIAYGTKEYYEHEERRKKEVAEARKRIEERHRREREDRESGRHSSGGIASVSLYRKAREDSRSQELGTS